MRSVNDNYMGSMKSVSAFLIIAFVGLCLMLPEPVSAHLAEDIGESGQLYSYYIEGPTRPVIDGFFNTPAGGGNSEWGQAYVRVIRMINWNGSKEINATVFLMNDAEHLYISISYVYENSGNNQNFVEIFFDEGDSDPNYDGNHDDKLTGTSSAPNENGVKCKKDTITELTDFNWNGSAWGSDGDASTNFEAEVDGDIVSTQLKYEFKIPLNSKDDSSLASDLNVGPSDELGIIIHARLQGQGIAYTDYYWSWTNGNISDANDWGDLRLGVKRSDLTMYSTYAINGIPKIDGDISSDFSWADSYEREMVFTNFNGSKLNVKIYLIEDPDNTFIYIGVVVYDSKSSQNDRILIHFEQNYTSLPSPERDFIMDKNKENLLTVSSAESFTDRKFTAAGGIANWVEDTEDPSNENQSGEVNYYLSPSRYEFEFKLNYSAAMDGFQTEDLYLSSNAFIGMQIQYYDGNGGDYPNYWWEYNGNTNATLIDKNNNIFLAMGYSYMQLGGPAIKLISPRDGGIVSRNTYDFKIMAVDENANGVKWCGFQVSGEISWISLIKEPSSDIWSSAWDTTSLNNGPKTVTIIALDDDGIAVRRYIDIQVSNVGTGTPPVISSFYLKPSEPQPLAGADVEFTAQASSADGVKFYVDGSWIGDMTEVGTGIYDYSLDTTQFKDGKHQFRAIAYNAYGEKSLTRSYTIDNWNLVSNAIDDPSVAISGIYTFTVRPNPAQDVVYTEFFVDGTMFGRDDSLSLGRHQFSIDTTLFKDGIHSAKAVSYDPDGNFMMSFLTFETDNWHPSISIDSPTDGSTVSGTVGITVSGTDLVSVSLYIDESLYKTEISTGPLTLAVDTTKFNDGFHTIKVIGNDIDSTNVMDSATLWFKNDDTGPKCAIVTPVSSEVVYDDIIVRVYAYDVSGVNIVRLSIDDGPGIPMASEQGSSYYIYYIPILSLSPGEHTLKATAYDIHDNSASSNVISFTNGILDTDSDGILDIVDTDLDGDGITNAEDDFPTDPAEWLDSDSDGVGNNADTDDDNDGWVDNTEKQYSTDPLNPSDHPSDLDNDGIPDAGDNDIDGDGVPNLLDAFPENPEEQIDLDKDGIGDNSDVDIDGDQVFNDADSFPFNKTDWSDLDDDGVGDNSDSDIDGDGISNSNDPFPNDPNEWSDLDGDGIGDNSDLDIDDDGKQNENDVFLYVASEWNDLDGDGIGDNSDDDKDGDGISNSIDAFPANKNEFSDKDSDGIGDNSDSDIDGDGRINSDDAFPFDVAEWRDLDGDGIGDNTDSDIDGDGISNDNDVFPDNKNECHDTDSDGIGDNSDEDIDGDGALNINDDLPFDATEIVDTDDDGTGNNKDKDDDNDGVPDSEDLAPLNPRIGTADYTWLALPVLLVVLYILTIILMFRRTKDNSKNIKPGEKHTKESSKSEKSIKP